MPSPRYRAAAFVLALTACSRPQAVTPAVSIPAPGPPPASLTAHVALQKAASGLMQPLDLRFAPGDTSGTLYVVEKIGRIRLLRGGKVLAEPFLDISGAVSTDGERGLLGLAFDPRFQQTHRFFIDYTNLQGDTRVASVLTKAGNPDQADPTSARVLVKVAKPFANHNGGNLVFGPDGLLYMGTGDGGAGYDPMNRAQNDQELLGKMLVIDVNAPEPKAVRAAKGLRNPWRYSFDRKTGDLYIADVGQDRFEEVDVVAAGTVQGRNFGWRIMEGLHCTYGDTCDRTGLVLPVVEYNHPQGCAITGGFVYRGKALPDLDGTYFYSDFCTSFLRSFRWQGGAAVDRYDWSKSLDPDKHLSAIASFGEDADGELYVISLNGSIWRFVRKS